MPVDVELDYSGSHINMCNCHTQEWPSQDERRLSVDFHVENDKVDGDKEIPDLDRNILCNPRGVAS